MSGVRLTATAAHVTGWHFLCHPPPHPSQLVHSLTAGHLGFRSTYKHTGCNGPVSPFPNLYNLFAMSSLLLTPLPPPPPWCSKSILLPIGQQQQLIGWNAAAKSEDTKTVNIPTCKWLQSIQLGRKRDGAVTRKGRRSSSLANALKYICCPSQYCTIPMAQPILYCV